MAIVGEAVIAVRPNLSPFKRDVEQGVNRTKVKPLKIKADAAGFKKSLSPVKSAVLGLGAAFAGVKVAGFFKDSVNAASDLSESLSKTRVVFGDSAKEVERFARTSATSLGLSQQAALEATATLGNLFVALKIGKPAAADMSQSMVTLAGDLASFNNVKPEEALEALRSGLVGETEPLRKFGVNLNDVTLRQKALELGLIKTTKDALSPAAKAQAAYSLILDQTKTAQGDFTRTSKGLANQQRILAAQVENLKARIGSALLPIVTRAVSTFNDWLPKIQEVGGAIGKFVDEIASAKDWKARISIVWDKIGEAKAALAKLLFGSDVFKGQQTIHMPGLVDGLKQTFAEIDWGSIGQTISDGLKSGLDAAAPIAESMGKKIDDGIAAIRARIPALATLGAEIIATIFVTLTDPAFWVAHWQLAVGVALAVIPVGKFAQGGKLILATLLKPLARFAPEIGPLITRGLEAITSRIPGWGSKAGTAIGTAIKFVAGHAWSAAKALADGVWSRIKAKFDDLPRIVKAALNLLVNLGIVSTAAAAFTAAKNFGTKVYNGIVDKVKTIAAKVVQFVNQIPGVITAWAATAYNAAVGLGSQIVSGIAAGIRSAPGAIKDAIGSIVSGAISWGKKKAKVGSPSRLFAEELGQPMVMGMIAGVLEMSGKLKKTMSQAVLDAVTSAKQSLSSLAGSLSASLNALLDAKLDSSGAGQNLRKAQKDQAALQLQQQIADLQTTIGNAEATEAERSSARAELAVVLAQQAFDLEQDKVDAAKAANERQLADLAQALNTGLITQKVYAEKVRALLAQQGATYQSAGDNLGLAFADGFLTQLNDMLAQAKLIVQAGLPDLNALRSGITDPLAVVRQEIRDQQAELTQVKKDAKSKDSAGGTKITAAEQKRIDAETQQLNALKALAAAMERAGDKSVQVSVVSDPNGFLRLAGAQVTAAAR